MQPPTNLGITKGVLLIPEKSQLSIKDMDCPDAAMVIGTRLDLEKPLLCVEGAQHLVLYIIGIKLQKYLDNLVVTCQSM